MTPKILMITALLAAAPALAQPAQPAQPALAQSQPPQSPQPPAGSHAGMAAQHYGQRAAMFPSMTDAGRQIMQAAMAAGGNRRADRQQMEAVREQMLTLLSADRIDLAAVKRVTDEERALAEASRKQRQAAMLAAVQKLSLEDRKAFVADSRAMKARMQSRMDGRRSKLREHMQRRSMAEPMPLDS